MIGRAALLTAIGKNDRSGDEVIVLEGRLPENEINA